MLSGKKQTAVSYCQGESEERVARKQHYVVMSTTNYLFSEMKKHPFSLFLECSSYIVISVSLIMCTFTAKVMTDTLNK